MAQTLLGDVPEFVDSKLDYIAQPNKSKAGVLAQDTVEVMVRFNVSLQDFKSNNLMV